MLEIVYESRNTEIRQYADYWELTIRNPSESRFLSFTATLHDFSDLCDLLQVAREAVCRCDDDT